MAEQASLASKLRDYNSRHRSDKTAEYPRDGLGDTQEDKALLEEYYIKFKGGAGNKYSLIPKFYSKV